MERVDGEMMRAAIAAAGRVRTHPNPRVGAVVVAADGTQVGRGGHAGPGRPHAEVVALETAGHRAAGSTLYVTLEPCAHHGRTPPCTDIIVESGVARVVVAVEDPDPQVSGRGLSALRRAGIEVEVGTLARQAREVDPAYFHHRETGRPRLTLKMATTLDGQIAATDGSSQWITSTESREESHRLRAEADAVMVGAGTVLADDPQLTVRLDGYREEQPLPIVVAGRRPLPIGAAVFKNKAMVLAATRLDLPAEVVRVPEAADSQVDLAAGLGLLGERGIVDLLVEGGPRLAGSLLRAGLIDRAVFFVGAAVAGGSGLSPFGGDFATMADLRSAEIVEVRTVGPDLMIEYRIGGGAA